MENKKQSVKDFFQNLTTFFKRKKQPVKSVEEAELIIKECKSYLIFSFVGLIVCSVINAVLSLVGSLIGGTLGNIISGLGIVLMLVGAIFMVGLVYFGINYYVLKRAINRLKNLTCDKCGALFTRKECIDWREVSRHASRSSTSRSSNTTYYSNVVITCKCSKCGEIKAFSETLSTGHSSATKYGADADSRSVESVIDDYFNGMIRA